ncbi:MAG TPA: M23 family metallopeptidase [Puia sp.]|jgi:murein DD-endopeptidase MepM/ murein hydrolase activator NlpD
MKKLILLCYGFLATTSVCLAQRTNPNRNNDLENQDLNRRRQAREVRNLELERNRIVVKDERNSRGEIEFTCENKAFCDYIVDVTFTEEQNLQADIPQPIHITVAPGTHRIFTLKKITLGQPTRLSWRYKSFRGVTNPRPDNNFSYLLPVAPGKETRISELYYVPGRFGGEPEPLGWYSLGLHVHSGDTVYAARSGRVVETLEHSEVEDTSSSISYTRGETFVQIYHKDNTFGNYRVFRDSSIFVHPGDWVEAGQPIGIAGGDKYSSGPQVQFSVTYNHDEEVVKDGESTDRVHHWAYVPIQFWTKGQGAKHLTNHSTYTSEHPPAVITSEMSKKETKKWMENHNRTS